MKNSPTSPTLNEQQIRGCIAQIDLDIINALKGQSTKPLRELLDERNYYGDLLKQLIGK